MPYNVEKLQVWKIVRTNNVGTFSCDGCGKVWESAQEQFMGTRLRGYVHHLCPVCFIEAFETMKAHIGDVTT